MENLEHLITRSLKAYYKNRLYAPIIYLIFLMIISVIFPVKEMLFPKHYNQSDIVLTDMFENKEMYAEFQLQELYFTGYTSKWFDNTRGYYYYTMIGPECVVVLLDPKTCEQGVSTIEEVTVKGMILHDSKSARNLLSNLANDLSWNEDGIMSTVSSYTISEPDATNFVTRSMSFIIVATGLFDVLCILTYVSFIIFPEICPQVLKLRSYGKPSELLAEAEEELATLPQLATEDMFITEHYFIETSKYGVAIVPIDEIIWIYKYSTLHKLFWHHFAISYTLHITAGRRHYIKCPKNIKSDIDGIIDYLSEANHDILVGFSEENRLLVEEIQNDFETIRKLRGFLSKKV